MRVQILTILGMVIGYGNGGSVRKRVDDEFHSLLTVDMERHLGNVWEPFDPSKDTAMFWQVPKAGSTDALAYFTICMDLSEATRVGLTERSEKLEILHIDVHKFVNVDVSTPIGIKHAGHHGLAASGLADIVSTAYVYEASHELFDTNHKGKMFALFRHPVERLVSKFYYMQTAKHERSFNPELAHLTLAEYAKRPEYVGDNWMTRMLIGKPTGRLNDHDVEVARDIVRRKCLVGLTSEMDESLDRFQAYFGWTLKDGMRGPVHQTGEECRHSFFYPDQDKHGVKFNTHKHPKLRRGTEEWALLAKAANYDLLLYETVMQVFEEQKALFR